MPGLSQREIAARAGVAQPSVAKAVKAGHLAVGADGRIDPRHPGNRDWIDNHKTGVDTLGRLLPARRRTAGASLDLADILNPDFDFTAVLEKLARS
jgi:hypothetical protein